jgi:hypothetical protein
VKFPFDDTVQGLVVVVVVPFMGNVVVGAGVVVVVVLVKLAQRGLLSLPAEQFLQTRICHSMFNCMKKLG